MKLSLPKSSSILKWSLPVRGRGLKHQFGDRSGRPHLSLPVRGRGLKLRVALRGQGFPRSLPVRGRGLKLERENWPKIVTGRSPCGGVD